MDGSGGRPTLSSSTEPRGRSTPARAADPSPHGLVARRRGDVGRDTRPHVERCRCPSRSNTSDRPPTDAGPAPATIDSLAPVVGVNGRHAAGEPGADVVGDHARLRDAEDRSGPARRDDAAGRRVDDPRATRDLAARGDRQPPVRCPPEVRREGPPVSGVRARPGRSRTAVPPRVARRHTPRSSRVARSTRCSNVAPRSMSRTALRMTDASTAIVDAQPPAGSIARSAGPRAVVIADQDDALDGTRGERLRGQGEQPGASPDHPEREPLARQRARGIEHGVHPEPGHAGGGWSRSDRRPARGRIPRWVRRLEHGRPGDAGRPQQRDRGQGHERTRESKHLHEGLLRRDIRREEGEAASVVMGTYAPLTGSGPVVPSRHQPGSSDPCRSDAACREAGANPAQSRYGDRPFRGGSPVADPPSPLEPSRERSGASCDPPPDPSFDPEARGSSFLVPPCIRSSRGRTLPGDGPSPPHPVPRPAAAPAGRGPRRLLVAGRQREPDRRRARVPVARRDADGATHARADAPRRPRRRPGRSPSRTTRGPRSRSRPSRRRSPRSPTPRPRSCSGSASATGSSARSRSSTLSGRGRRRPRRRQVRRRSTSRRSWPRARTS